jgi:hypothetical protein
MAKLLGDPNFFSETQPAEMNIFSMPPTQTAVERTYISDTRPISSISSPTAPVEFNISGQNRENGLDYIDLKRTSLYVKCKILMRLKNVQPLICYCSRFDRRSTSPCTASSSLPATSTTHTRRSCKRCCIPAGRSRKER